LENRYGDVGGNKWAKHGNEKPEGTICIIERMCL